MQVRSQSAVASQQKQVVVMEEEKGIVSLNYIVVMLPPKHLLFDSRCHVVPTENLFPQPHQSSLSRGRREALVRQFVPHRRIVRRHAIHLVHLEL
jgi:hypothetical protein